MNTVYDISDGKPFDNDAWWENAAAISYQQARANLRCSRDSEWLDVSPQEATRLLGILKRFSAVNGIEGREAHATDWDIHSSWSPPRKLLLNYPEHWGRPGVYIIHDVVRLRHPVTQGCVWRFYPRYVGKSVDVGSRLLGYVNGTPGEAVVDNVFFDHLVIKGPMLPVDKPSDPRLLKKYMRDSVYPRDWVDPKERRRAIKERELWIQVAHTDEPARLEQSMVRYFRSQGLEIWNDPLLYSVTPPYAPPKKAPTPKEVFGA